MGIMVYSLLWVMQDFVHQPLLCIELCHFESWPLRDRTGPTMMTSERLFRSFRDLALFGVRVDWALEYHTLILFFLMEPL